jgi:formylglycine-generating enzyme required for sulfatase activity
MTSLSRSIGLLFVGATCLLACGPTEQPPTPGCRSDAECKGDRICEAGQCVSPSGTTQPKAAASSANPKGSATGPAPVASPGGVSAGGTGASASGSGASHSCPDGMLPIPGGAFEMGSDRPYPRTAAEVGFESRDGYGWQPKHRVVLSPYCIDQFEVNVARYKACVESKKCSVPGFWAGANNSNWGVAGRENDPITLVSYEQAADFCRTNGGFLPSEAQWEYAARGTDGREYPWGNQPGDGLITCADSLASNQGKKLLAAFGEASKCFAGVHGTWPVGSAPAGASPFGALDMAGNVMEWVEDMLDYSFYKRSPEKDPRNPPPKTLAATGVVRGGGWSHGGGAPNLAPSWNTKAYWREPMPYLIDGQPARDAEIGFRCAAWPTSPGSP